jgi:hypothetical protein
VLAALVETSFAAGDPLRAMSGFGPRVNVGRGVGRAAGLSADGP